MPKLDLDEVLDYQVSGDPDRAKVQAILYLVSCANDELAHDELLKSPNEGKHYEIFVDFGRELFYAAEVGTDRPGHDRLGVLKFDTFAEWLRKDSHVSLD